MTAEHVDERKYEVIVVLDPASGEQGVAQEIEGIVALIERFGGTDTKVVDWGRQQIAYPVKKRQFGVYKCVLVTTQNSGFVAELTAQLRITEAVLKFQVHRVTSSKRKFKGNIRAGQDSAASASATA